MNQVCRLQEKFASSCSQKFHIVLVDKVNAEEIYLYVPNQNKEVAEVVAEFLNKHCVQNDAFHFEVKSAEDLEDLVANDA